jgi:hypothetical protein
MSKNAKRDRGPDQQDEAKTEYRVGYRRPPRHTQFKPGRSGNPRGRPSRYIEPAGNRWVLRGQFMHLCAKQVTFVEDGRREKMPIMMAVLRQLQIKALSGNMTAIKLLLPLYETMLTENEETQMKFMKLVLEEEERWEREEDRKNPKTPEQKRAYEEARRNRPPREPGEDFMSYLRRTGQYPVKKS